MNATGRGVLALGLTLGLIGAPAAWGQDASCPLPEKDRACCNAGPSYTADPSCDPLWALRQIGALEPEAAGLDGAGVTVAHVDVGLAQPPPDKRRHPQLEGAHIEVHSADGELLPLFRYGDCRAEHNCAPRDTKAQLEPIDALRRRLELATQPGHGTRTSSVLVSPKGSEPYDVRGIAPGARLVPYLVTGGTILSQGRMLQTADAFVTAAAEDRLPLLGTPPDPGSNRVDVLSISMGIRSPDPALEAALRMAEREGIIVVAAAGQGPLPTSSVRFPAQYPGAVAVTGTHVDGRPWRTAGRGPAVAVAAPACGVWRANWEPRGDLEVAVVGRGQGTSFSTPLVAGAAALWIQKHTRVALDARYGRTGVPAAFRYLLVHAGHRTPEDLCKLAQPTPGRSTEAEWPASAREAVCPTVLPTWDLKRRGAGILAVDRLLAAPLPTAQQVCEEVYCTRGAVDWDMVCPPGSEGRRDAAAVDALLRESSKADVDEERFTFVNGVSLFGKPFGGVSLASLSPTLSFGVIFSDHHRTEPKGLILQAHGATRGFKLGAGYVRSFEYSPFGHSRRFEGGRFPGFGPTVGVALRGAYMRASRANFVGPELELVFYRVKLEVGYFRRLGAAPSDGKRGRVTVALGTGF